MSGAAPQEDFPFMKLHDTKFKLFETDLNSGTINNVGWKLIQAKMLSENNVSLSAMNFKLETNPLMMFAKHFNSIRNYNKSLLYCEKLLLIISLVFSY